MLFKNEKRLLARPNYRVGDVIVYQEWYEKDKQEFVKVIQSKIVYANGLLDIDDKTDTFYWSYVTEDMLGENGSYDDTVEEENILYKL